MKSPRTVVKSIFCFNTGRSGSAYLATILDEGRNCVSHHEPAPDGFGAPLQAFNKGDAAAMIEVARAKASQIEEANRKDLIYAESSHCFVKGFGWPLMEMFDPATVGIIVLRRDPEKIARSMFRVGTSALSYAGRKFYLTPDRLNPAIKPPAFFGLPGRLGYETAWKASRRWQKLKRLLRVTGDPRGPFPAYQRATIDWYIKEMKALEDQFKDRYPQCSYFEIDIDMLNEAAHTQRMCDFFGVEIDARNIGALGEPVNL